MLPREVRVARYPAKVDELRQKRIRRCESHALGEIPRLLARDFEVNGVEPSFRGLWNLWIPEPSGCITNRFTIVVSRCFAVWPELPRVIVLRAVESQQAKAPQTLPVHAARQTLHSLPGPESDHAECFTP